MTQASNASISPTIAQAPDTSTSPPSTQASNAQVSNASVARASNASKSPTIAQVLEAIEVSLLGDVSG